MSEVVNVRLDTEEVRVFRQAAAERGYTVSELLRLLIRRGARDLHRLPTNRQPGHVDPRRAGDRFAVTLGASA